MRKGTIKLPSNKIMQVINDVFYVPNLKTSLLSTGQLLEKGSMISSRTYSFKVDMTKNKIFPLNLHDSADAYYVTKLKEEA
ncbi:Retrovirus-related Pol polyprotein from transposon TNT 1-94 [Gossypium australe]|uniref:Retrovirus-related Pol polyprotein from transposon TNT 1-94 n=1 Tax=Gossypium australe TaxID=47621 RepID=A0A5B6WGN5_9ROSI|nr:Retrovirus-related Pol polyprotein from transposon TNT 1-94 [Gossypium australe]